MKRIYNYNTGVLESVKYNNDVDFEGRDNKLYEESKHSLCEKLSVFDRTLESPKTQIYSDDQLYDIINAAKKGVITYMLQSRGNGLAKALAATCNEDCIVLSGRDLNYKLDRVSPEEIIIPGDDLYIIDEFAFIRNTHIIDEILNLVFDNNLNVIFVSNIDSVNNESIMEALGNKCVYYVYTPRIKQDPMDESANINVRESVTDRFAKYRRLYEGEEDGENKENDDMFVGLGDDNADNGNEEPKDEEPKDEEPKDEEPKEDDDEIVPLTAIVLTVKKGTEDACKDELVDAGIPEDKIEILDDDKENEGEDETVEIKVDAEYYDELETYLKDVKGIDLAEKLGGEVIKDDEDDKKGEDEEGDDDKSDDVNDNSDNADSADNKKDKSDDGDFDDVFGDLFDGEPEK